MAEDLVSRIARLHRRLDALQESGLSQKEKAEIRKWANREDEELRDLKATITEHKQLYLQGLSSDDRAHRTDCHPVWMVSFDLYLDQIGDMTLAYEKGKAIIQCSVEPSSLKSLKVYAYAADGDLLCINSARGLRYGERGANWSVTTLVVDVPHPPGTFLFHPIEGGHAQWIFVGQRWGLHDAVLWLDFSRQEEQAPLGTV